MGAVYDADGSGQVISLHTFGSGDRVAQDHAHEAQVEVPEWVADLDSMPPAGTVVKVRITGRAVRVQRRGSAPGAGHGTASPSFFIVGPAADGPLADRGVHSREAARR